MKKSNLKIKKLIYFITLLGVLTSCGPHRMKCGPGRRCIVEHTIQVKPNLPQQKNS